MSRLLFGAGGQVGRELARLLGDNPDDALLDRSDVDLGDGEALLAALASHRPRLILNAAAYTAVDRAEDQPEQATAVNATAPGTMARWAAEHDACLVHFSTDYVFDGSADRPYREDDACRPLGVYGESKLAGERAVRASGCRYLLLRTSWVYASHGHNFLRSMLRLADERDRLTIVDDQWGAPTWARALAENALAAVQVLDREDDWRRRGGTYHLSANGRTTWCRFARAILSAAMERGLLSSMPDLVPIATEDWPTAARRPACSVLDNARFEEAFGRPVASWENQLGGCMDALASARLAADLRSGE